MHLAARSNTKNIALILEHMAERAGAKGGSPYYDLNKIDSIGQTPLFKAIANNSIEMLKYLLTKGADITIKDHRGDTVKDYLLRYHMQDKEMLNIYERYECRLQISNFINFGELLANFKWTKPFVKELYRACFI